jgi:hypothetical protein
MQRIKFSLSLFTVICLVFLVNFTNINSATADTPITGADVNIIYGFSGRNGASPYAAIGWQVWNPGDRYGFAWKVSTSAITDAELIALTPGSGNRTQNNGNDGSGGFGRWEWNGAPINFDTEYIFKLGIFNPAGDLIDTASITIPAFSDPGSPSDGLSNMPVFYPTGGTNPYALGGLFNEIPPAPVVSDTTVSSGIVEVDIRFPDPEIISDIQFSTDDGTTWLTGDFNAEGYGSIYGTLRIEKKSDGNSLVGGASYTMKVRAKNDTLSGSVATLNCFVYSSSSLSSCSSGGGGGGGGGGGTPTTNTSQLITISQSTTGFPQLFQKLTKLVAQSILLITSGMKKKTTDKIKISVPKSSKDVCKVKGQTIQSNKAGVCTVIITKTSKSGVKEIKSVQIKFSKSGK